ncbi:MAG: hypothetical protein KF703_09780 [Actinobacteria bacterium]|nr:hypothetical protein [Actinomycetota bacterium]
MGDAASETPDSWSVEDAAVARRGPRWGLIVGGVVLVALLVAGGVIGFQIAMEKTKKAWPASAGGPPAGFGGAPAEVAADVAPGVYFWNDFGGWHLWIVNGDGVSGMKGTITSGDEFASGEVATAGEGTATTEGKTLTFDLPAEPRVVGVDFNPGFYAEKLTVALEAGGGPVDPKLLTVGRERTVSALPFVLDKVREDDAADR